jgi:hypothetical protein
MRRALLLVLLTVFLAACGSGVGVRVKGGSSTPPKWSVHIPF